MAINKTELCSSQRFDYIVANSLFSTKSWSNGFTPENEQFNRFAYGMLPGDHPGSIRLQIPPRREEVVINPAI